MEKAIIHLKRQSAYTDFFRAYHIFLDGKESGTIRQTENCTFEVQPGHHEVFLKIDWCSSPLHTVTIGAGEEVKLICKGKLPTVLLWPYFMTFGH
jgi:hypothetical protein